MFSFPKSKRLLNRADFKPAMDSGDKVVCPEMVVLMKKSEDGGLRLGLVVSKKVGNSVERNRVKRVLRESFRHFAGRSDGEVNSENTVSVLGSSDIVVIARAKAAEVSNETLGLAFERSLSRLAQRGKRDAASKGQK